MRIRMTVASAIALTGVLLAGCSAPADPVPPSTSPPPAPVATYEGSGTVIERDGVTQMCLGGEAQSIPPGCIAPVVLAGWDWADVASGSVMVVDTPRGSVTFTTQPFTVTGTVSGSETPAGSATLTLTEPAVPRVSFEPWDDDKRVVVPSGLSSVELAQIVEGRLRDLVDFFVATVEGGVIRVSVPFDDGSLQRLVDDDLGEGVVVVTSLLRPA